MGRVNGESAGSNQELVVRVVESDVPNHSTIQTQGPSEGTLSFGDGWRSAAPL
jgi:hypothetical protein